MENNAMTNVNEYNRVYFALNNIFDEIEGDDFYKYIFPSNQKKGEYSENFDKPNAIFLYNDDKDEGRDRTYRRRVMLDDTWDDDYQEYILENPLTLCSGLSYRGKKNRLENAQKMNALIFDLDSVGINELKTFLLRAGKEPGLRTLPQPTFIVLSGTGLHIYYVFEEPIDLFPNIKLQLKALKYDLTFKMWDYKSTTKKKQIQYQSINQAFRMPGSINKKYNLPVVAFCTGEKITLDYLNSYVDEEKNKVDINKPLKPTQYTLSESKEKFPEWYERVIVKKDKRAKKWIVKKDLYYWWIRQSYRVKGGHRYYFLMAMAIYAVKCNVSKKELRDDMYILFEELKDIQHNHALDEGDIKSALETYDRQYYNFTIDDIVKLTDIQIPKNKRNYRKQEDHVRMMSLIRDNMTHPNGEWRNKEGRPSKKNLVLQYIKENPNDTPTKIARELGISRSTVYKHME